MFILYLFLFLIILFIIGFFLEEFFLYKTDKKFSLPGKKVQCSNGNIHVYSKGSGNVTVVFSSGLNSTSPYCEFNKLQEKVSSIANTAVYERYGYGFSEDSNKSTSLDQLVDDIKKALTESGINPPYLFVPHSMASLEILRYAQKYPDDVAGIILNEGMSPSFTLMAPTQPQFLIRIFQFFKFTGVFHLLNIIFKKSTLNTQIDKLNFYLRIKNYWNENMILESKNLKYYAETLLKNPTINEIPLTILTSKNHKNLNAETIEKWNLTQKDLLNWSSQSKQIIVNNSDHFIHIDNNDIILIAIQDLITKS